MDSQTIEVDVLVIGGGTAGPMAAVKAKEANPKLRVLLLEKANVKRSGAISMGMDGLNNAVIPGHATPEQYVKEITVANDGVVNQKTVMAYAQHSFEMIEQLRQTSIGVSEAVAVLASSLERSGFIRGMPVKPRASRKTIVRPDDSEDAPSAKGKAA